jgi:hypothetical protein
VYSSNREIISKPQGDDQSRAACCLPRHDLEPNSAITQVIDGSVSG